MTDVALSNTLAEHAAVIRALGKRVVGDVIEIGRRLADCRDNHCKHGEWLPWLQREFGWTLQTAHNFINVFEAVGKSQKFGDLDIPVSSLYLLAAPSTPEAVRTEVIERAEAGERFTHDQVKQVVAEGRGINTGVAMHPYAERGLDLYETPPAAVRALLKVESLAGPIWECACGPGSIVRALRDAGHHVIATDLESYGCPDSVGGVDFLAQMRAPKGAATIVTNPPFMHADNFVRHALSLVPRVVMLQRLAFLESAGRSDILDGGKLARIYVFRNRLTMHRAGWHGPKVDSGAVAFTWMVWDRDHQGPATLHRISWSDAAPAAAEAEAPTP